MRFVKIISKQSTLRIRSFRARSSAFEKNVVFGNFLQLSIPQQVMLLGASLTSTNFGIWCVFGSEKWQIQPSDVAFCTVVDID